jgi:hypothetical protein
MRAHAGAWEREQLRRKRREIKPKEIKSMKYIF